MIQKIEQKPKNRYYITIAIFMMLFVSFFDYLFSNTSLSAFPINYSFAIGASVITLLVGFYGDIKPMLFWLPFYIFVGIHWYRFKFSAYYFIIYISTLCLPALVPYFNDKLRKRFIKTIVWFGLFFAFGCIFQKLFNSVYLSVVPGLFKSSTRAFILECNANDVMAGFSYQPTASASAITIGILANWTRFKENKMSKVIQFFLYWGLILTGKRAFFLISIAVPFVMFYYKNRTGKFYRFVLVLISALVLIYFYYSVSLDSEVVVLRRLGELTADNVDMDVATSGRGELIRKAMYQFREHPLTGMGWGRFGAKYGTAVHNVYIQLLCETGIFGMASFVFCALIMLGKSVKKLKNTDDNDDAKAILLLSVGIQFAFLTYSFTGNPLYDLQWIWMYFFMGAVALAIKTDVKEEKNEENRDTDVSLRR